MLSIAYGGTLLRAPRRPEGRSERARLWRIGRDVAQGVEAALRACGLSGDGMSATGPVALDSRVLHVDIGEPIRAVLELRSGLLPADVAAVADRIAAALHVAHVEVEPWRASGYARLTFWVSAPPERDPWADPITPAGPVASVAGDVMLGRDELGGIVGWSPIRDMHVIVQGQTRSGKSVGLYGLLGSLAAAEDVHVVGCDPTGLLLRPWSKRPEHAGWHSLGMTTPALHADLVERLVKRMDARIAELPEDADQVEISPDCPLTVVVLEEYPGLVRALKTSDKAAHARFTAAVSRLLSEGGKAGFRVVIVAQRSDADVIGGFERAQATTRLSFRVDNADALRMLHPQITPEVTARHMIERPGVCLLTRPGEPLTRLRTPETTYQDYTRLVTRR